MPTLSLDLLGPLQARVDGRQGQGPHLSAASVG